MTYDFDTIWQRRGTSCVKWDCDEALDTTPLWVADMDFRVAKPIIDALRRRVEHGIFGYTHVPQRYYDSIIRWFASRHQWHIEPDWILYTTGVVPALSVAVKALCNPGDKVLIQTPVYNCFFSSIRNNDCEVVESRLVQAADGRWEVDWEDMERKAADPQVRLFVLCNPHNPCGRVWTKEELVRMNDICISHDVMVVADEIHCELVMPDHRYTPFASVSDDCLDNSITLSSPSKSFNTAGLQIANIICSSSTIRQRIDRAININEVCDVNPFGVDALIAAYDEGGEWIDQLCQYLWRNYQSLCQFFRQHLPHLPVTPLEGTYLVWVDCRSLGVDSDTLKHRLHDEAHVLVNSGTMYGEAGEGWIRINIACPQATLMQALELMKPVLEKKQ